MHRRLIGTAVVGCALVGGVVALSLTRKEEARATDARIPPGRVLIAPGTTEGLTGVVELGFRASGTVAEVLVDTGSKVNQGDLLARLDARLARIRLEEAEASLSLARARRERAVAKSQTAEQRMAEAALNEAEADAAERGRQVVRGEQLKQSHAIGSAELDRLRAAADAANARVGAARARVSLVREGPRAEVRHEADAAVRLAEVALQEAQALLSDTELRAPSDAVVLRRWVEPGEQTSLTPPTVAFELADFSKIRVRAEVDEQDIGLVFAGQRGWAEAPAFGGRSFPGSVVRVMLDLGRRRGVADDPRVRADTRVLEVLLELDNAPSLPVGLRMDVHLPCEQQDSTNPVSARAQ